MKIVWVRYRLLVLVSVIAIMVVFSILFSLRDNSAKQRSLAIQTASTESYATERETLSTNGSVHLDNTENFNLKTNKTFIPSKIQSLNSIYEQTNQKSSQADCGQPLLVLVIQVHDRLEYLNQLLESLGNNQLIEEALLITSHDFYSREIHQLVTSVNFTRLIPIYYPYSQQLYPHSYPGADPNDCPKSISKQEVAKIECNNAASPDQYGNFREAAFTTIKHHWFWKIITVFDKLQCLRSYTGQVLFLEEDHYTTPDFIFSAIKLADLKEESCPECDFINLGVYLPKYSEDQFARNANSFEWVAGEHNMGFGMERNTWNRIKSCGEYFCNFDDYNWDWSLEAVGMFCLNQNFVVLSLSVPRIFHLGKCGIHQKVESCDPKQLAEEARKSFLSRDVMFPSKIELLGPIKPAQKARMPNIRGFGGWGDSRDRNLCFAYLREDFPLQMEDRIY